MTSRDQADEWSAVVARFRRQRILVLGDAILDEYLHGQCNRLSPEAPVPVLRVESVRRVIGGAGNTAANVVSLGGNATLIALVGTDESGETLTRCAREAGVDIRTVVSGVKTLRKTRVVGHQQQIVRLDYEDVQTPDDATASAILSLFDTCVTNCDIVVISDYAKGFLSLELSRAIIARAHRAGRRVVIDPRPEHRECYTGCDYLTPNWRESRALLRWPDAEPTPDAVDAVARALATELHTKVVLTLGPNGIAFCSEDGGETFALPTTAREVFDVSGAGDTVVAAFSLALASGADHSTAVSLANRAAGVAVGKFGTATVSAAEILRDTDAPRLVPRDALSKLSATLRAQGRRIVTVSGSFDVLHAGHLHILNEASRQGDVLIVGLHNDDLVRSKKGHARPVVPERQRAEMLLALRIVDFVHVLDQVDSITFLRETNPDVHVCWCDCGQDCVEGELVRGNGGRLHIVDRPAGVSTSILFDRLRAVTSRD